MTPCWLIDIFYPVPPDGLPKYIELAGKKKSGWAICLSQRQPARVCKPRKARNIKALTWQEVEKNIYLRGPDSLNGRYYSSAAVADEGVCLYKTPWDYTLKITTWTYYLLARVFYPAKMASSFSAHTNDYLDQTSFFFKQKMSVVRREVFSEEKSVVSLGFLRHIQQLSSRMIGLDHIWSWPQRLNF